jgi:hypothetical protein
MPKIHAVAAAVSLACLVAPPSYGQSSDDLKEIRDQIEQMKKEYETRIRALEKRLAAAEAKAAQADRRASQAKRVAASARHQAAQAEEQVAQATAAPEQAPAAPPASTQQERQNAFNPAISLILQGTYADLSQDPDTYHIGGFIPPGEVGPEKSGLSIAETELAISATVDPYFSGFFTAALEPDGGVSVENAYFTTPMLGHGISVQGGRFFPDIGYLNPQHQHAWDFVDAPLPYRAFLGGQLADDGVQLKWVAPTRLFVELGGEAGRGLSFPGSDNSDRNGAQMFALFGHVGGDVGASNSWRTGVSYLQASPRDRSYQDLDSAGTLVTNAFSGTSRLWIGDFVWKWAPLGNPTNRNFKLQAEYMWRDEDGTLAFDTDALLGNPVAGSYSSRQSGWYAQAVYQFMPRWRVGVRYDQLYSGNPSIGLVDSGPLSAADFPSLARYNPWGTTAMIDWSPSEFSRLRLQYQVDNSRPNATDHQVYLQYIMSLGAHGAHIW